MKPNNDQNEIKPNPKNETSNFSLMSREKFATNPIQKNFDREEQESKQFTFNAQQNLENDAYTEMTGQGEMSQQITPFVKKKIEQKGFGRLTDYGKNTPINEDNPDHLSK
jgi:hypothetical protein